MFTYKKEGHSWFETFNLEQPKIFEYSNQRIEIIFKFRTSAIGVYVHDEDLNKYFPKKVHLEENNPLEVLNYFYSSEEFKLFYSILEEALIKVMVHYKGFPSALHQTKLLIIEFRDTGTLDMYHKENEFHTLTLGYNIKRLWYSPRTNLTDISHELYHVISAFHEGEQIQAKKLRRWEEKLHSAVTSNRKEVERWIDLADKELVTQIRPNLNLEFFYGNNKRIYRNQLIDMGLNIIAMELEDEDYINQELDYEWKHEDHISKFEKMKQHCEAIRNKFQDNSLYRNFLISIMVLLEFIQGYTYMPFNIVPYSLIDDYWHPKKRFFVVFKEKNYHQTAINHIQIFESQIREYFEPEAADKFLLFWGHYKKIAKDMNIWVDPLNPDVTRQIHNIESLESAKEGYELLNRLFYDLFKKIKEFEAQLPR